MGKKVEKAEKQVVEKKEKKVKEKKEKKPKEKKEKKPKEKKEKKAKKEKKVKDPNAPKKALSAFFFYQKTRREGLKKENPSIDHKEIVKQMSEEWNRLADKDKAHYNKLAEDDKIRYAKEKNDYEKKSAPAKAAEGDKKKKQKKSD